MFKFSLATASAWFLLCFTPAPLWAGMITYNFTTTQVNSGGPLSVTFSVSDSVLASGVLTGSDIIPGSLMGTSATFPGIVFDQNETNPSGSIDNLDPTTGLPTSASDSTLELVLYTTTIPGAELDVSFSSANTTQTEVGYTTIEGSEIDNVQGYWTSTITTTAVPEPGCLTLALLGIGGLTGTWLTRRAGNGGRRPARSDVGRRPLANRGV